MGSTSKVERSAPDLGKVPSGYGRNFFAGEHCPMQDVTHDFDLFFTLGEPFYSAHVAKRSVTIQKRLLWKVTNSYGMLFSMGVVWDGYEHFDEKRYTENKRKTQ